MSLFTLFATNVNDVSAQKKKKKAAGGPQARANEGDDPISSYLDKGDRYADAGDWAEALKAYQQATAMNPSHAEAHISVGDAYLSLGKYKEAFASYEEAIRLAPSNADAHYSLGMAYVTMSMLGAAFKPLLKAISLDPNYAEAYYGIGHVYLKLENFKEAVGYLKQAVKLNDDFPDAHLSLGLAYLGLGQTELAEKELKVLEGKDGALARKLDKELRRVGSSVTVAQQQADAQRGTDTAAEVPAVRPQPRQPKLGNETQSPAVPTQPRPSQAAPAEQSPVASAPPLASEVTLWDRIKNSDDPEEFVAYLKKYPAGGFSGLARIRLRVLESKRGGAAPVIAAPPASVEVPRGPTIEETLRLLKEDFSNKLTYTTTAPGEDDNVVKVVSEVVIEYEPLQFDNCRLEWRDRKDTLSLDLSDLDPLGVKVWPRSRPNTTFSTPIWNLTIKVAGGAHAIRVVKGDGSGTAKGYSDLDLQFDKKEKAERLARLLQQAIKLCGR